MTQAFKRCTGCGANNDTRNVICRTCGKQLSGASFTLTESVTPHVPCEVVYSDGTTASGPTPLPRMSPRQQEYAQLLMRGMVQLRAWHSKYGEHQPQWLPPAGDVRWLEDAQAYVDGSKGELT